MAGPRITLTCDCGEQSRIAYGESLTCGCGRQWSTAQIPAAEYGRLAAVVRRYKRAGWIGGSLLALLMLFFLLTQPHLLLFVVPAVLMGWVAWVRPVVRRRYRRELATLSKSWELRPESGR